MANKETTEKVNPETVYLPVVDGEHSHQLEINVLVTILDPEVRYRTHASILRAAAPRKNNPRTELFYVYPSDFSSPNHRPYATVGVFVR
jgi:hypothetical protein